MKKNQKRGQETKTPGTTPPSSSSPILTREEFYKLVPQHYRPAAFFQHFTVEFNKMKELREYSQAIGTSVIFLNPANDDGDDFEDPKCRCFLNKKKTNFKVLHLEGTNLEKYVGKHCYLVCPPQEALDEDWIQRVHHGNGRCCQHYAGSTMRGNPCRKPFKGFALHHLLLTDCEDNEPPVVVVQREKIVLDLVSSDGSEDDAPRPKPAKIVNRKRSLSLPQADKKEKKSQKTNSNSSPSPVAPPPVYQAPIGIADLDALLDVATQGSADPMDDLMDIVIQQVEFDDLVDVVPPPPPPPSSPLPTPEEMAQLLDIMLGTQVAAPAPAAAVSTLSPFPLVPLPSSMTTSLSLATLPPAPLSLLEEEIIEEEVVIEEGLLAPMEIDPPSPPAPAPQHPNLLEPSAEEVEQWQASSSSSLNTTQAVSPPPPVAPFLSKNSNVLQPVNDQQHRTKLLAQKLSGHHENESFSYATPDNTLSLSVSSGDNLFSLMSSYPTDYQRQIVHNVLIIPNEMVTRCSSRLPALSMLLTLSNTTEAPPADMHAFRSEDLILQDGHTYASLFLYPGFLAVLFASDDIRISYYTRHVIPTTPLALELWTMQDHRVLSDDTLIYLNAGLHLLYLPPIVGCPTNSRLNLVIYAVHGRESPVHLSIAGLCPTDGLPIRMLQQDSDASLYTGIIQPLTAVLKMAQANRLRGSSRSSPPPLTPPSSSSSSSSPPPSLHAALFDSSSSIHSRNDFYLAHSQGDVEESQSSLRKLIDWCTHLRIAFVDADPTSIRSPAFRFVLNPPDPSINVLLYESGIVVCNAFAMALNLTCASVTALTESNGEPKLTAYTVLDEKSPLYEPFQRFKRLSKQFEDVHPASYEKEFALLKEILKVSAEMWGEPVPYLRINQTGLFTIKFNNSGIILKKPLRTSTVVLPLPSPSSPPPPSALLQ